MSQVIRIFTKLYSLNAFGKFNQHQSRPHFTIESPTCKLKFQTPCTLVSFKNSNIAREVKLNSNPDKLGYGNQAQQLALTTDMKPS